MIKPFEINSDSEVDFKKVYFDINKTRFYGEGSLSWNLVDGFYLKSQMKSESSPKNLKIQFGGGGSVPKKCVKFIINELWRAYCPNVFVSDFDEISLHTSGKLSKEFSNLILFSDISFLLKEKHPKGICSFCVKKDTRFPYPVEKHTIVNNKIININSSDSGIYFNDENIEFYGSVNQFSQLEIQWFLQNNVFSKRDQWRLAIIIRDTLSICNGQTFPILMRELHRNNKTLIELIKKKEPINLGFLNPISYEDSMNNEFFSRLFYVLLRNDTNALIIRNLFYRIADALQLNNYALIEFSISSSLEAALRTYFKKPFSLESRDFKGVKSSLDKIRCKYFDDEFSKEWIEIFNSIFSYFQVLRHSNAHASWLDKEEIETSKTDVRFQNLVYICKFYGYFIKALLGYKNQKPQYL